MDKVEADQDQIEAFMIRRYGKLTAYPDDDSWRDWWMATYGIVTLAYQEGWRQATVMGREPIKKRARGGRL